MPNAIDNISKDISLLLHFFMVCCACAFSQCANCHRVPARALIYFTLLSFTFIYFTFLLWNF